MSNEEREALRGYLHSIQALCVAAFAMLEPEGEGRPIEGVQDIEEPQESGPKVFGRKAG
jgi:hypothetical protein